jgi:hypothetical protein
MSKILITISGYYERFQINTIESCIKRAANPENISFAIAHHEDHIVDTSHIFNRISRYLIPKRDKIGVQKPKHILSNMMQDEDYLLSIDSHVIMMPNWDKVLIEDYLHRVSTSKNKNIVISGNFGNSIQLGDLDYQYCLDNYFNNDEFFNTQEKNFIDEFIIDGNPKSVKGDADYYEMALNKVPYLTHGNGTKPIELSNTYSGNFSFFPRSWFNKYNFSKEMFFSADQPETAMNIYTSGYDIWSPRFKYHCHMVDHSSTRGGVVAEFEGKTVQANRYFDIEKDYKAILWFRDKINNGYSEERPRSVNEFLDFFKLNKELYK